MAGAMDGSNISVQVTYTELLQKKSMGSNVREDIPKIARGTPGALQPVPGEMDSLKNQKLEKLHDAGSDGSIDGS